MDPLQSWLVVVDAKGMPIHSQLFRHELEIAIWLVQKNVYRGYGETQEEAHKNAEAWRKQKQ